MKTKASKALQEVWEMKDAAYEETRHLSGAAYFNYIHEQIQKAFPPGIHAKKIQGIKSGSRAAPQENEVASSPSVAEP